MVKMLLVFVVMAVPKQTCIEQWNKQHLIQGFMNGKPQELFLRDDTPKPELKYQVVVSSTALQVSDADKACYDIYLGKMEVPVVKVK